MNKLPLWYFTVFLSFFDKKESVFKKNNFLFYGRVSIWHKSYILVVQFKIWVTFLIIVCCNTDSRHFLWQTKLRRRRCNMGLTNNYFLFSFTKKYNHIYVTFDIWQSLLCLFLAQWIQVCQLTVWAGNKRAAVCPHCSIYTLLNNWTHHTYLPITHILDFNWFYQEWYIPNL